MTMTVKDVAELAKVSVRTLHHYDEIGLLKPSARSEAGYRLYTDANLSALQQILFFRELGFPLSEIVRIMAEPTFDRAAALRAQRTLLERKAERVFAMLAAIDTALDVVEKGGDMDRHEMFEVFGEFDPSEYEDEVQERWGETDAYRESARRTARYTKADWERIKAEGSANLDAMIALFDSGVAPDDERAMDVADEARLQIDRTFYPCSHEMHVQLGQMYIADSRFTAFYDTHRTGLAQWLCSAIEANATRAGA